MSEDFARLDRPVPPRAIVRIMAAVYIPLELPEGCTVDEAVKIAKRHAVEEKRRVWVALSELRCITIRPDGTSYESYGLPHTTLGGLPGALFPEQLRSKAGLRTAKGGGGRWWRRGRKRSSGAIGSCE